MNDYEHTYQQQNIGRDAVKAAVNLNGLHRQQVSQAKQMRADVRYATTRYTCKRKNNKKQASIEAQYLLRSKLLAPVRIRREQ